MAKTQSVPRIGKEVSQFLDAVRAVTSEEKPGSLLSVRKVRERAGLPKAMFDLIALDLQRRGKLVLHHHDFPQSLSKSDLAQLIEAPNSVYYIGLALPLTATPPRPPVKSA